MSWVICRVMSLTEAFRPGCESSLGVLWQIVVACCFDSVWLSCTYLLQTASNFQKPEARRANICEHTGTSHRLNIYHVESLHFLRPVDR